MADFTGIIQAKAAQFGVDPNDIATIIQVESGGDSNAYRPEPRINDASYGLMQILGSTARGLGYTGDFAGLYDPATNIELGTRLWAQMQTRFHGDKAAMYSAYNSGSGTAYLNDSDVAGRVSRFLALLESGVESVAGDAGVAVLAVLTFFYLWRN